ncbi:MAG TPA: hypothetical protein VHY35_15745 [Stellaceae bacterium]|jgi:hypothetical protein|nr:hypothetical protein [Stellaceae bacterium]
MADEYGVPQPESADDFQSFMLDLHDLRSHAQEAGYSEEGIELLTKARLIFIDEFERKFPGHGKGRAVWR